MKILGLAMTFVSLATVGAFAKDAPKPLTLDQAIDLGIKNATLVLKAGTQKEITGADLMAAYGRFLPNLGVSAGYSYSTGRTFSPVGAGVIESTYRQGNYAVSSSINLFNGFGDVAATRAANNRDTASDFSLERAKQQIAIDVAQAFLQVHLDNQAVEINEQNFKVSQERYKLILAKRNVGSANNADLYRQESETAQAETDLISSRQQAHVDLLRLLQRIRIDAREDYVIEQPPLKEQAIAKLPPEDELISDALKSRKDYSAQLSLSKAAEDDIAFAQRTYWPTLDLGAGLSGLGRNFSQLNVGGQDQLPANQPSIFEQLGNQNQFTVGLTLNWAIFDRFVTTNAVRRAAAFNVNAKIDLDDTQKQVVVDVRQGYSDYQTAADQTRTTAKAANASQQAFNVINGRYRVGSSSYLDLAAAQASLVQAQLQHAQALVNLKLRAEALLYFTGRDPRGNL